MARPTSTYHAARKATGQRLPWHAYQGDPGSVRSSRRRRRAWRIAALTRGEAKREAHARHVQTVKRQQAEGLEWRAIRFRRNRELRTGRARP